MDKTWTPGRRLVCRTKWPWVHTSTSVYSYSVRDKWMTGKGGNELAIRLWWYNSVASDWNPSWHLLELQVVYSIESVRSVNIHPKKPYSRWISLCGSTEYIYRVDCFTRLKCWSSHHHSEAGEENLRWKLIRIRKGPDRTPARRRTILHVWGSFRAFLVECEGPTRRSFGIFCMIGRFFDPEAWHQQRPKKCHKYW